MSEHGMPAPVPRVLWRLRRAGSGVVVGRSNRPPGTEAPGGRAHAFLTLPPISAQNGLNCSRWKFEEFSFTASFRSHTTKPMRATETHAGAQPFPWERIMPYCLHCGHILEEDEKTICARCKRDELIRRSTQGDPRERLRAKKLGQNRPPVAGGKITVLRERPER